MAGWFEDAGEIALALDQWILDEQPRDALRLLAAKATALYDSGRGSDQPHDRPASCDGRAR